MFKGKGCRDGMDREIRGFRGFEGFLELYSAWRCVPLYRGRFCGMLKAVNVGKRISKICGHVCTSSPMLMLSNLAQVLCSY